MPVTDEATVMAWEDGERERWLSRIAALGHGPEQPGWADAVDAAGDFTDLPARQVSWLLAEGPEATARKLLGKTDELRYRVPQRIDLSRVAVARLGVDALPLAVAGTAHSADQMGVLMLPFRGPEPARLVAGWLRHLGSARLWARLWLERHVETAARALVPATIGRAGAGRRNAEDAVRYLASIGHGPMLITTAEGYGASVHAAVIALVGPDDGVLTPVPPLFSTPARAARRAKVPSWLNLGDLPKISLADGGIMSVEDTGRLILALTSSRLADPPEPAPGDPEGPFGRPMVVESWEAAQPMVAPPDPEVEKLIAGCDRPSLAEFGRALMEAWISGGLPPSEAWVVVAQAHLGDDATVDYLAPKVRAWPQDSRHQRAIEGYAVLCAIGSDAAMRHLLAIEQRMSRGSRNDRLRVYLAQVAAGRGMTVAQVADRLAPTLGLDAGITLDYGPRSFPVVTDEHLTAFVQGPTGKLLARPPKPGVRDTKPEAYPWFLQFKKDLRAAAAVQLVRLERDMFARYARPARDLPGFLLPHPILGPIARRLLWGEYDAGDRLIRAVRVAEDGTLADLDDDTVTLDGDARVRIVHPAELGDDLTAWARVFADYEIMQPFPQVNRPAVVLTAAERAATSLPGFGPVRNDRFDEPVNGRWHGEGHGTSYTPYTRLWTELPGGLTLLAELDKPVSTSSYDPVSEHRITEIWVDEAPSDHFGAARRIPFGDCDPVALSEALVELYALRG